MGHMGPHILCTPDLWCILFPIPLYFTFIVNSIVFLYWLRLSPQGDKGKHGSIAFMQCAASVFILDFKGGTELSPFTLLFCFN